MKQNILGQSPQMCRRRLVKQAMLCAAAAAVTLWLNLALAALRKPDNHYLFLSVNIVTDIVCGWLLLFFLSTRLLPQLHLYRLTQRQHTILQAAVEQISPKTVRYMNLDCRQVTANGHIFFLPDNTIELEAGKEYTFHLVANTVVEVVL